MATTHHTRVYGSIKDWNPWLAICAREGFKPDILYPVGRKYIVAASDLGDLYIRRGPRGPLGISADPIFFGQRLYKEAVRVLRRHMYDVGNPPLSVRWQPDAYVEKDTNKVS